MLDVRYGTAAKSHENAFFRKFAQSLKNYFDSRDINGILLGFPVCLVRDDLQIDALLITDKTMIIIDFKNYSGTLTLPREADFKKGAWKMSNGLKVKGGSSPNPFYQLGLQRDRLAGILSMTAKNLTRFNPRHISTVVCFTEPVEVDGSIPGKFKLSFFIANSESYLEQIFDIISVEGESDDLLNNKFVRLLNTKIFETNSYDCFIVPSFDTNETQNKKTDGLHSSSTVHDPNIWQHVENFMSGDDDVLIITGSVGSGKLSLAERLRENAYSSGFTSARLFALSNRVKNNLMISRGIEDVESLYATLYDFSKKEIDDVTGKEIIPLASFSPVDAFEDLEPQDNIEQLRSLFIVYESQMVTDSYRDEGTVRFGSGELLKDILEYLNIPTSKSNKIIFVGDRFQLGFGSWAQSSLNPSAYQENIKTSSLELPNTDEPDGIEKTCLDIAYHIENDTFSELVIAPNEMVSLAPSESERTLVESVVDNYRTEKIIAYSNKRCYDLNLYIKRNVIGNGAQLATDDLVIFNNQLSSFPVSVAPTGQVPAFDTSEPVRIENGEFGMIQRVIGPTLSRSFTFEDIDEPVSLNLICAEVKLQSGATVTIEALSEYLYSERAGLSDYEERAMQILLRELLASFEKSHPFAPGDPDFDEMIQAGDFVETESGKYRRKDDARYLTEYEKRHRKRIASTLTSDPNSEYFRWHNAARIKFGWCMTVHKAMSYKWPRVVFATSYDQGRNNREYFKFVYTGISRATDSISLVKWENLSPFSETIFVRTPTGTGKKKRSIIAKVEEGTPGQVVEELLKDVLDEETIIEAIESKNYLEIVHLKQGEAQTSIGFDYNGKGEISSPRRIKGDQQLFESVASNFQIDDVELSASPLGDFYNRLNHDVLRDISISLTKPFQYQDRIDLKKGDKHAEIRIIYDKHGLISRFELVSGDCGVFDKAIEDIKNYYEPTAETAEVNE